jgi:hypothetical protein
MRHSVLHRGPGHEQAPPHARGLQAREGGDDRRAYLDASSERLAYAGVREMIRSEERVVAGTTPMRPAERVRLRTVLVTGHVKKTVPVRREEIRLETEPRPEGGERVQ